MSSKTKEGGRAPSGSPRAAGLGTIAVHGGEASGRGAGPLDTPIVLSAAFGFESAEAARAAFSGEGLVYGRWGSPTVSALEAKLAALEGGEAAVATSSGMAAISGALLAFLRAGDHVVAPRGMYAESARLLRERLPALGIETTFVDEGDAGAYERALRPETRLLYVETPANPTLALTDLEAVAALGRARGLLTVADNTFATPVFQRPLALGIDLVVHSMTKALSGHGDVLGGCVVGGRELCARVADLVVKGLGSVLSPFSAHLVERGISTLPLRVEKAAASALEIARFLEAQRAVARVHYPGLESHPDHALARRQMRGFGSLVAFELEGGRCAAEALVEGVRLIRHAVSLGDVRSLIVHPASTTASTMPAADRRAAGIGDGLVRLSVGIEDLPDLLADLELGLGRAQAALELARSASPR